MEDVRKGEVLWFNVERGYGFIRDFEQKDDVFVHYSKIEAPMGEFKILDQGDIVEFNRVVVERGSAHKSQAQNVILVEKAKPKNIPIANNGG